MAQRSVQINVVHTTLDENNIFILSNLKIRFNNFLVKWVTFFRSPFLVFSNKDNGSSKATKTLWFVQGLQVSHLK